MDPTERELFLEQLRKFRAIRSIEIARSNIDRLELLVSCVKKEIRIRELILANKRQALSEPTTAPVCNDIL